MGKNSNNYSSPIYLFFKSEFPSKHIIMFNLKTFGVLKLKTILSEIGINFTINF